MQREVTSLNKKKIAQKSEIEILLKKKAALNEKRIQFDKELNDQRSQYRNEIFNGFNLIYYVVLKYLEKSLSKLLKIYKVLKFYSYF